ncbi:MAG: hypothetical protein PGN23_17290 [Sphingomonas adhaesiva]|uniref:hypothetical protein n=1 Tax=Sphingomonas adhaesiva TaxID=28212 RepID=UPI002FF5BC2D
MATVDKTPTQPDIHGVVQGNGGTTDNLAGGAGNDRLEGHAANNSYYGGAGNDTFIISGKFAESSGAHEGASRAFGDQFAFVTDFGGAGGWSASNNDFIALIGWGAGSTLTLNGPAGDGANGAKVYYYTITDGVTGNVFNMEINSLNGKELGKGDYAFY